MIDLAQLRMAARCVFIAVEREVATDLSKRMNDAADEIERLRELVATVACPAGGWTGMPKELEGNCTVADCLKDKSCGCIFGDALTPHQTDPAS